MSTASDFEILALTQAEADYYDRLQSQGYALCSASSAQHSCHEPVRFESSYTYVTGAKGRHTMAHRKYCAQHAKAFCERHGLTLPESPVKP